MGLFSTIFGKSPKPQKSESGNHAYDYLMGAYSPMVSGGTGAFSLANSLLGVGGGGSAGTADRVVDMWKDGIKGNAKAAEKAGQPTTYTIPGTPGTAGGAADGEGAFQNYLDSTGYNFIKDEAMDGLTNAYAGRGILRSGAAGKAFQDRAANIGRTYFDNYLGHLQKQSGLGLGAGGLIGNAGQWSKGTGGTAGTGGIFGAIAQVAPYIAMASEPCLKENIEYVGTRPDGLDVYDFDYRRDLEPWLPEGRFRGVMVDQVEAIRPDALGPIIKGYRTVNYERLAA